MEPAVLLLLVYVMPGQRPDMQKWFPERTIEECWEDAAAFVKRGIPPIMKEKGAIGVLAGCKELEKPGEDG